MNGKGGAGGMQNLMKQANQLQMKIKKLQEEQAQKEHEATSGGGAVTVKVRGESEILELKITEEVMKAGDVEMLQDLIVTATNEALRTAKMTNAKEMEKITGSFSFPGLN
jgi:DNA-binding YbaB/EbfC family protein